MKSALSLRLSLLVLLAVFVCRDALATDAIVVADASVNTAYPNTNFGGLSNLYAGNGNTALLQFDLSSVPAGTTAAQIGQVSLKLYVNRVNTAGTISVQPVTSAWSELSVTSGTVPGLGSAISSFPVSLANQYVVIDVTTLVQGWLTSPGTNFGIALSSANANVLFDSKENDETAHAASLDITVVSQGPVGPAGPQGIQGVAGAAGAPGAQGPQGPAGVDGATGAVGLTYRQGWTSGASYAASDSVTFNGTTYIALASNTNQEPDTSPSVWSVLAQAGAIGPQGVAGPAGPAGPVGATGAQGVQGIQGPAGSTGATGAIGATGPQGAVGATGATGPQGPNGATGTFSFASNYASGTTYTQGQVVFCSTTCTTNGSSYISLVNSNTGFDPPTNSTQWALVADVGATGAQGPQGLQGTTGATGATGATGTFSFALNYATGTTYTQGQVVFCSTACSTNGSSYISLVNSNTGFDPPTNSTQWALVAHAGATGAQGTAGPQGTTGATGATGATGPAGATGAQGAAGATGPAGPTGATGAQGATGATGPQGPAGANGATGATGTTGTFSFASNYTSGTTYTQGQVVFCSTACSTNGSSYLSLVDSNVGFDPPTSNVKWALIAQAGATGATGLTGATGPAGPAGPTGPTGATGAAGTGSHIFMANVALGESNTTTEYFAPDSSGDPSITGTFISYNQFATILPVACTFDSLFLASGQSTFGNFGSPITITLFHNGSATALAKSITPPSGTNLVTAQITGQSIAVAAGDTIAFQATSASFSTDASFVPIGIVSVSTHCQ